MRSRFFLLSAVLCFASVSLLGKSDTQNIQEEFEWVYSDKAKSDVPPPTLETVFRYRIDHEEKRNTKKIIVEYNRNGEWFGIRSMDNKSNSVLGHDRVKILGWERTKDYHSLEFLTIKVEAHSNSVYFLAVAIEAEDGRVLIFRDNDDQLRVDISDPSGKTWNSKSIKYDHELERLYGFADGSIATFCACCPKTVVLTQEEVQGVRLPHSEF